MKKFTSFVLAASMTLVTTGAFAGGAPEPMPEPIPVVVTEGGSSSGTGLWLALGGVVALGLLVSQDDSTN